jgi:hypothetical protein
MVISFSTSKSIGTLLIYKKELIFKRPIHVFGIGEYSVFVFEIKGENLSLVHEIKIDSMPKRIDPIPQSVCRIENDIFILYNNPNMIKICRLAYSLLKEVFKLTLEVIDSKKQESFSELRDVTTLFKTVEIQLVEMSQMKKRRESIVSIEKKKFDGLDFDQTFSKDPSNFYI